MAEQQQADVIARAQQSEHLSKLPLYFGDRTKDALTAEAFVARVEAAREALRWTDGQTINFVYMSLRDGANTWFLGLKRKQVSLTDWTEFKANFLIHYGVSKTARTTTVSLQEMAMKSKETVGDFTNRVIQVIDDMETIILKTPFALPETAPANVAAIEDWRDLAAAQKTIVVNYIAERSRSYTLNGVATQLIVSGLREPIRSKIMERVGLTTMTETINAAIELELIHGTSAPLTSALKISELNLEISPEDSSEVAALKQTVLNLKRGQRFTGGGQMSGRTNFNRDTSKLTCYYCHKKGHIVPECKNKVADEARGVHQKARPKPTPAPGPGQNNETNQGELKALTWEKSTDPAPLNY